MENQFPHRGITMHQLPVGGNFPGFVFAVGSALIFLLAIPALWFVLIAALVVGLIAATVLQMTHKDPSESSRLSLKI